MSAWAAFRSILGHSPNPQPPSPAPPPPAPPAQPSPAPASRGGWLSWLPACLSPGMREPPEQLGSPIVKRAAEADEDDDEGDDGGRFKKGPRGEYGSAAERWHARATRQAVMDSLSNGCGCGCTDSLNVGEVLEARQAMARKEGKEQREFTRQYLSQNAAPEKSIGYNFHPVTDSQRMLCYRGWEVCRSRPLRDVCAR